MRGEILIIPKWQGNKIKNFDRLLTKNKDDVEVLNMATCALINYLPLIGFTEITEDNTQDVWIRVAIFQAIHGSLYFINHHDDRQPIFLTEEDINLHIGLETEGRSTSLIDFCEYYCKKNLAHSPPPSWIANDKKSMRETVLRAKNPPEDLLY